MRTAEGFTVLTGRRGREVIRGRAADIRETAREMMAPPPEGEVAAAVAANA